MTSSNSEVAERLYTAILHLRKPEAIIAIEKALESEKQQAVVEALDFAIEQCSQFDTPQGVARFLTAHKNINYTLKPDQLKKEKK